MKRPPIHTGVLTLERVRSQSRARAAISRILADADAKAEVRKFARRHPELTPEGQRLRAAEQAVRAAHEEYRAALKAFRDITR